MSAGSVEEAIDAFLDRMRTIAACITTRPLIAIRRRGLLAPTTISFVPESEPVRLRTTSGERSVSLILRVECATEQADRQRSYSATIVAYSYRILDRGGNEILAYHWHPAGASRVTHPHLHLSDKVNPIDVGRGQEPLALADLHIASGHVRLRDVVRFLIEEFDMQPLMPD